VILLDYFIINIMLKKSSIKTASIKRNKKELRNRASKSSVKKPRKSSIKHKVSCPITFTNINEDAAEICAVNWKCGNRTLYAPGVLNKCKKLKKKYSTDAKTGNIKIIYLNADVYSSPLTRREFEKRHIKKYKNMK